MYRDLVLLIPGVMLLNGRLRDMGRTGSLLILPASLVVTVAIALWGCMAASDPALSER